jgi:probable HAF family extracellular repeat protein
MRAFMSCKSLWRSSVIPLLSVFIELSPSGAAAQIYDITNVGTLCEPGSSGYCSAPGAGSMAFDVNNWGRVVGTSHWVYGESGCFRTAPNEVIDPTNDRLFLDDLQSLACVAYGINDSEVVVGTRWNHQSPTLGDPFAFTYNIDMTTLSTMLECHQQVVGPSIGCRRSYGFALNSTGTVVGTAQTSDLEPEILYHAFRVHLPAASFDDLKTLDLPNLPNTSEARGINDQNIIVGSSYTVPGGVVERAVLFGTQPVFDIGTLGGSACTFCSSAANAINNVGLGQVVGWSTLSASGLRHAFFRQLAFGGSEMVDLGDLCVGNEHGFCRSEAFAINDVGQIVGESQAKYGSQSTRAFVYRTQTGVMQDLNKSLSPADRILWDLTDARGINDLGQIVGTGLYQGEYMRAYRLDPLPPQLVTNLGQILELFNLADKGIEQSLRAKLRTTQNALARDDRAAACGQTGALDDEVRARAGRGLTQHQATTIMAGAALLQRKLNCW